jgi:hypothetical protein
MYMYVCIYIKISLTQSCNLIKEEIPFQTVLHVSSYIFLNYALISPDYVGLITTICSVNH